MKILLALALAAAISAHVAAQTLDPRYEAIGEMTATVGDVTYEMVIPYDREKDRAYASRKIIMGSFLTINVVGRVVRENGRPGSPMLQITLQERFGSMALVSAEVFDKGFDEPLVMGPDGGKGAVVSYELDGDEMTAVVEGEFLRLTGYAAGTARVADGAEPLQARIEWRVALPPMDP